MKRRRTRPARVRRENALGAVLFMGGTLAIASLLILRAMLNPGKLDARGCPAGGLKTITVAIVDATDELSGVQKLSLQNELQTVVDSVPVGGGLEWWRVARSASEVPRPWKDMVCKPPKTVSWWIGNPKQVEKYYNEHFYQPMLDTVTELATGRSEPESPIMETIQAVGLRVFAAPRYAAATSKTLVIASNLLQNSPAFHQLIPSRA
jgi:hypothetical protein